MNADACTCPEPWDWQHANVCGYCNGNIRRDRPIEEDVSERDELVKAIRMAVVSWNTLGPRKVGEDVSEFIADFLIENRITPHNHDAIGVYGNCPACDTVVPPGVSDSE